MPTSQRRKHFRMQTNNDDPSLTEQHHKLGTDINYIISKYQKNRVIDPALIKSGNYGFATSHDFNSAMLLVTQAQRQFDSLPADFRKEFNDDPAQFLHYCQEPENFEVLVEMGLAEPGEAPTAVSRHEVSEVGCLHTLGASYLQERG